MTDAKTGQTVFTGAALFDGQRLHPGAALAVADGRIVSLTAAPRPGDSVTDLCGGILAPGLIDLQVNGGDGVMLGDVPDAAGIARICATHARLGTLNLLPTLITDTPEVTRAVVQAGIAAAKAGVPGFLGLHLEGPHLDPARKGAHDPALIRPMGEDDLALLLQAAAALPHLMLTLAPEAARQDQIAALAAAGVMVSLGHSNTGVAAAKAAIAAGARCATHLFNAMSPLGHREPGLVGAVLDSPGVCAGIICDGVHVAPESLRVALAAKRGPGPSGGLFMVTDAMAAAGTSVAEFTLGGRRILRANGRLTLADGTLAGADYALPQGIAHLTGIGVPVETALAMATSVPAACLGRPDLGRLAPGLPADFVHLGDPGHLLGAWRGGTRLV